VELQHTRKHMGWIHTFLRLSEMHRACLLNHHWLLPRRCLCRTVQVVSACKKAVTHYSNFLASFKDKIDHSSSTSVHLPSGKVDSSDEPHVLAAAFHLARMLHKQASLESFQ